MKRAVDTTAVPWFDPSASAASLAVEAHGRTWFSGHAAGRDGAGDVAAEARTVYADVEQALAAAGRDWADVVRVTEYVTAEALEDRDAVAGERTRRLGDTDPAVGTVVAHGLLPDGARVAVEVVTADRGAATPGAGDGLVFLSSLTAVRPDGTVAGGDDLVAQTAAIYEQAATLLAPLGLGTEHVVKTVEFVKPHTRRDYPRTGRVRKEHLAAPYGGATGIVMDELAHPDALISIDLVASPLPREAVNPGWERYGKLTYGPGLRLGDLLVMSGQAALDVETEEAVLPGDVVAQARYTYGNILRVLDAAGVGPEALVHTVEYVTPDGLADYPGVADVRRELLGEPSPSATRLVCSGLLRPEFLIEIDPWAVLPGSPA